MCSGLRGWGSSTPVRFRSTSWAGTQGQECFQHGGGKTRSNLARCCKLQSPQGHRQLTPFSGLSLRTSPGAGVLWICRFHGTRVPELSPQPAHAAKPGLCAIEDTSPRTSQCVPAELHLTPLPRAEGCSLFLGLCRGGRAQGPIPSTCHEHIPMPRGSRSATRIRICLCGKLGLPGSIKTARLLSPATAMHCRSQRDHLVYWQSPASLTVPKGRLLWKSFSE